MPFFDAHLDLAYLAELGRDMHAETDDCRGRLLPAAVTLPALRRAAVTHCLGTIFTESVADPATPGAETGAFAYPAGDALAAWKAGQRQLRLYHAWRDAGLIELLPRRTPERARSAQTPSAPSSRARSASEGSSSSSSSTSPSRAAGASPRSKAPDTPTPAPLRLGILMECADPIEAPGQLADWADAGVLAVGMAWVHQSRYAAGNAVPPAERRGLTDLGRALVREMDRLHLTHDLSHLSQHAVEELFEATDAPVIASHSNCRSLMGAHDDPKTQRHLADATIREVARRGGVIGINLLSDFLDPAIRRGQRCTIDAAVRHIDHICTLTGSTHHVALGTDADGGFAADRLPQGIVALTDLPRLLEALASKGWSDADLDRFAIGNWAGFFTT